MSRYDVLPDRVVAYLWPRAGGTTFEFKFRLRYGVQAHTPASRLYDYYNPDAYSYSCRSISRFNKNQVLPKGNAWNPS